MDNYKPTKLALETSYYNEKKADKAVEFISMLKHSDGAWYGKPFELMPWQETIIRDIFGIVDKKTGFRQFKTAYLEIPKKNGKSELAAAVALFLLFADGEMSAEVYSCAADTNQASIVFNTAKKMISQCPDLMKISKMMESTKRIIFNLTNSFYRVISSDSTNKQGYNISGLIFDEVFAQKTRALFDTMTKFTGDARRQPLHFLTTTAGRDKNSVCYELHCKSKAVLDGNLIDHTFYPALFGIEEDDNWEDEQVWKRCNPSICTTISLDNVRIAFAQAKQNPADEIWFRQFRLNEWNNADIRWAPMHKWDACGEENLKLEDFKGRDCYGGLDLSSTDDLTAFALAFPPRGNDFKYTLFPFFWLPENVIPTRVKRHHVPYDVWQKRGIFFTTEGDVVDYKAITEFINKISLEYDLKEVSFDRWGASKISQDLEEIGQDNGFEVVRFGQGFKDMSPPTKDFLQLIHEKKIRHGKHPTLDWCISNAIAETDAAGNVKLSKKKSTEKIDGAIAAVMALDRAMKNGGEPKLSVYDTRGMLFL